MTSNENIQTNELEFHPTDSTLRDVALEGEISDGITPSSSEEHFSTLNEPVRTTILRDVRAVGSKFLHVLYPKSSTALLREWDLWGPLFLCIVMGILLQSSSSEKAAVTPLIGDGGPQFAEVFGIFWLGAAVVTLNAKLLGGDISFFQSVCVLGYCVLPLTVALLICRIILLLHKASTVLFIIRLSIVSVAFGWSVFGSTAFMTSDRLPKRRALAVYPVFLFYFVISWLIISRA